MLFEDIKDLNYDTLKAIGNTIRHNGWSQNYVKTHCNRDLYKTLVDFHNQEYRSGIIFGLRRKVRY